MKLTKNTPKPVTPPPTITIELTMEEAKDLLKYVGPVAPCAQFGKSKFYSSFYYPLYWAVGGEGMTR